MVQRCVDSDSLFGVVLIKSGAEVGEPAEPHSVGTVAEIIDVQKLDDGRMLLKTRGHSRFSIVELSQDIPYLEGQVEALAEDTGEEIPAELLESIREATVRQVRLLLGLRGGWVRQARIPEDPTALSYFIARLLQVDVAQKQALLESTTSERLEFEREMLDEQAESLKKRVSDGLRGRFSSH